MVVNPTSNIVSISTPAANSGYKAYYINVKKKYNQATIQHKSSNISSTNLPKDSLVLTSNGYQGVATSTGLAILNDTSLQNILIYGSVCDVIHFAYVYDDVNSMNLRTYNGNEGYYDQVVLSNVNE